MGGEEKNAMQDEMKQLHFRDTFKPRHLYELTEKEKAEVLESQIFLKQKIDGNIKGRTVAGGNKQRDLISKEEASYPNVATEAVILIVLIESQ